MRCVVQRVNFSKINVDGELISEISKGLNVLVGIREDDTWADAQYIINKIIGLRIFEDKDGNLNLSLEDIKGEIHLISQFTLYGDARKGRRPSFVKAMRPEEANALYEKMYEEIKSKNIVVQKGVFGADMKMNIENDGPITILLDSRKEF